jgi:hypothetical protein
MTLAAVFFVAGCSTNSSMAVSLSPGATQAVDQGQAVSITATVANDTAAKGVTWVLTSGPGALSNTSTTAATYSANGAAGTAVITATSVSDTAKTATLTVTVTAAPAITTTTLPAGVEGTAYGNHAIAKTGGAGALTFTVSAGTLPPGLTLSSSGTISGTPTGPNGTVNFTVKVTDSSTVTPQNATQALSILINLPAAPSITTTTLPAGVEGTAYSQQVVATGFGTLTFSTSAGTLPPGLAMNASGHITGTPLGPNTTANFTVKVTDSSNPTQSITQALSILINLPLQPSISPSTLPNGNVGTLYNQVLTASNGLGPFTWSVSAGTLPAGLVLTSNNATATIGGTPTTQQSNVAFTIQLTDTSNPPQNGTQAYTVTIGAPLPLSVTTTSNQLPTGANGTPYPATNLTATGGINPYTWTVTVGTLPSGLNLSSAGAITGTPTVTGPSTFTVTVTDSNSATATASLTITISPASAPCPTGGNLGVLNGQYAFTMSGFDSDGAMALGGVFNADGAGHIATIVGVEDFNRVSGSTTLATPLTINSAGSSYTMGTDNRGCLTIVTGSGGSAVTSVFRFSLGSIVSNVATKGRLIEFDTTGTTGSGVLRKQDPTAFSTAQVNGHYAFGLVSPPAGTGGRFAAAGSALLSAGTITAGFIDTNDNGNINNSAGATNAQALTGTYAIDGTTGRAKLTFTVGSGGSVSAGYVVSATDLLNISLDPLTTGAPYTGTIMQQSGNPFSTIGAVNSSSVLASVGIPNLVPRVQVGIITIPSSGNLSFSINDTWDGTTLKVDQTNTATVSVASSGRVTLGGGGGGTSPIFYLVGANKGFFLGTDNQVEFGFFEPRSTTTLNAPKTFFFGTVNPADANVSNSLGVATFIVAGSNVSGTSDDSTGTSLNGNQTFTSTYSAFDVNGRGTINTGGSAGTIIYLISPTKAVLFDTSSSDASYQVAEQ